MNNEIGRKLTSLTLMTILLAWGYSAFAPSVMPEASAANANLFVSAENSQFQNYFAGPMVIEVVINDPSLSDTDEAKGEPDVTINGNKLRMFQGTDGLWYAYFADRTQARTADQTLVDGSGAAGTGLDFGVFCSKDSGFGSGLNLFTQSVGVSVARTVTGATNGTLAFIACSSTPAAGTALQNNVVRENKTVNGAFNNLGLGPGTARNLWPIIQLYDFTVSGNVVVQYNKGGNIQSTTLTFDTVEGFISEQLDRQSYPRGAHIHFTVADIGLNIDPTDEDSWSFQTISTNKTTHYQVFDENGASAGEAVADGVIDISGSLGDLMVEDGFEITLNTDSQNSGTPVVLIQDNADVVISNSTAATAGAGNSTSSGFLGFGTQPITLTETAPNTGVFVTYDEGDVSQLKITSDAERGTSATLSYDSDFTVLVGFGFATIDIQAPQDEWNSGEEIPVVLTDSDANKNSRADEDLDFNNADVSLIPGLTIGNPFTIGEKGTGDLTVAQALFLGNFTASAGANTLTADKGTFVLGATTTPTVVQANVTVQRFSDRAVLDLNATRSVTTLIVDTEATAADLFKVIKDPRGLQAPKSRFHGYNLVNIDLRAVNGSISSTGVDIYLLNTTDTDGVLQSVNNNGKLSVNSGTGITGLQRLVTGTSTQSLQLINSTANVNANLFTMNNNDKIAFLFNFTRVTPDSSVDKPIAADIFSFGFVGDGLLKSERINNYIARIEAEETGDNTSTFEGSLEYIMVNQLNILDSSLYTGLTTIGDDPSFVAHQDLDAEEAPRVNYLDLGADGVSTQIADQQDAPSHSGTVSFDKSNYKIADTVLVTLQDQDLNTDSELIDIFTAVDNDADPADDTVGEAGLFALTTGENLGRVLDITFNDATWVENANTAACDAKSGSEAGLAVTGFTLIETGIATGTFTGDFQVPAKVCVDPDGALSTPRNTQGLDMEVNYVDFRDASGQIIEVGDGAGIRANTGSVSLDRTVYPVPWGDREDFADSTASTPGSRSLFPLHLTAIVAAGGNDIDADETLGDGILTIHVQVNDPDFDVSAAGEDSIAQNTTDADGDFTKRGPVKITIIRGVSTVVLGYAGSDVAKNGVIDVGGNSNDLSSIRQLGPILETNPSSGIFEFDLDILYTDGPASETCPPTTSWTSLTNPGVQTAVEEQRFDLAASTGDYCILQGDIIQVEYSDPADASGSKAVATDSATFDLRNGALQSDKSVYIIGADAILTLIDPDLDLDNDLAETYNLDLVEWDSDAATVTLGQKGGGGSFDPEPSNFRETGDSTGIFQVVIEIPGTLSGDQLERGEEIVLEYTDWGPSGADYVGQEEEDINLTIFTSNFGATIELDQKVYTWTDKVYITIVAPDHNFDSNLIDDIGNTASDPLQVATRGNKLSNYRLVETGVDTGIFTGEVILTGFAHDANGDGTDDAGQIANGGTGPTDGTLKAQDDDGLTVSFEFSEDETVVGSALIRWNIGEVSWLEASYPASGTGVVRVIDPDMNLNPEAIDNFAVDVWSDSDSGGIDLTVTETNEATGIFEGTVSFTVADSSSGHRLRVAEGDTVTAEYEDRTLPDPYTTADELDITGTAFIGTVVPPLERAPATNARVVDAFGNTLDDVSVDQQVQITADLTNGQDREQPFAYLVQIQDEDGVTVSLAWITGSLSAGQSFSPALSWIPAAPGTYTATVFVWESVDNPTALSPPTSVDINVS